MILIIDNFLTTDECRELIEIYHQHEHLVKPWPVKPVDPCSYSINSSNISDPLVKKILSRTETLAKKYFNPKILIDWAELKKHEKKSFHPFHFDTTDGTTVLSSVTYLNTFSSGRTVFKDDIQVPPRAGRVLLFDGQKYLHGVSQSQEERYTIPIWYKLSS